jgi:hypothetical protein
MLFCFSVFSASSSPVKPKPKDVIQDIAGGQPEAACDSPVIVGGQPKSVLVRRKAVTPMWTTPARGARTERSIRETFEQNERLELQREMAKQRKQVDEEKIRKAQAERLKVSPRISVVWIGCTSRLREPHPRASPHPSAPGQMPPYRPTAPATARRSHHRAPTGPGLPRRGHATTRGPRHATLGVDVHHGRPSRGRKGAAAGQNRARQRSGIDAPEERLGALRPGLRRLRGPNRVP